ncbi:MAG: hypothetical protein CR981_00375 [Proteobacteria bacterium]|nr:MAG: hypothetical protein CR981_00375 [Pseudomonadota bacterium]
MLFPVMKREVHFGLIKRTAVATVITFILATMAILFFESTRIEEDLITGAAREGVLYTALYHAYLNTSDENTLAVLEEKAAAVLERTPYISIDFLTADKKVVAHTATTTGDKVNQLFLDQGIIFIPDNRVSGSRLISNWQIYLRVSWPLITGEETTAGGYICGIYQVTRDEMTGILRRIALTTALVFTAILCCSFCCYLFFLVFNNGLIRTVGHLNRANRFLLKALGSALAKSDVADKNHNPRVIIYSVVLAEHVSMSRDKIRALILGGFLHDLGMLDINQAILFSKEELTEHDRETIEAHPQAGAEMVKKQSWLNSAVPVIRSHHEKYDGTGYPAGLRREDIPENGRIFAIADAFDALTSTRPYRTALSIEQALEQMKRASGTHFDPVLLSAFLELAPELYKSVASLNTKELDRELNTIVTTYLKG